MLRIKLVLLVILAVLEANQAYSQMPAGDRILLSLTTQVSAFNDSGWNLIYQENFDSTYEAVDGQTFGTDGWLTYQLLNGGAITVANGYAWLNAPDFWNAALIRSSYILPDEYKLRTKIGYINYDLANYEQEDYDDPDFNDHNGYYENGMYFLTLTDDLCEGSQCAEFWWHRHRKMVIDVDNHLDYGGGETFHPVFMVYMSPDSNSGGNLLRTWDGDAWDYSPWNWNVAYTYDYDTWYYAELEKRDGFIILRLYDADQNIIEETTPVNIDLVNAMDDSLEYLYLGEPHTDDYEGDVRIDEITLLTPDTGGGTNYDYLPGDANMAAGIWPPLVIGGDVTYLVNYFRGAPTNPACELDNFYCAADANGDCNIIGSDVTRLVSYFRGTAELSFCPEYMPSWPTPDDLPAEAPDGWPGCTGRR
jgi:hypothetical protein